MRTGAEQPSFCRRAMTSLRGKLSGLTAIIWRILKSVMSACIYFSALVALWQKLLPRKGILILAYHRVNTLEPDPLNMAVSPRDFQAHTAYLAKHYHVISLDEAVKLLQGGHDLPKNSVVVTFDDGYHDNYRFALPALMRHRLPATFFLTVGPIDNRSRLWYDVISDLILNAQEKSIAIETLGGLTVNLDTPHRRNTATINVVGKAKQMVSRRRDELISELQDKLENHGKKAVSSGMLTWDQIREMRQNGCTFGAHTVTHPILSRVPLQQANEEIKDCKASIERELGEPIHHFAFPNGKRSDFNEQTVRLIAQAGFQSAATLIEGSNVGENVFLLKRIGIGLQHTGISGIFTRYVFAAEIAGIFDVLLLRKWRCKD